MAIDQVIRSAADMREAIQNHDIQCCDNAIVAARCQDPPPDNVGIKGACGVSPAGDYDAMCGVQTIDNLYACADFVHDLGTPAMMHRPTQDAKVAFGYDGSNNTYPRPGMTVS